MKYLFHGLASFVVALIALSPIAMAQHMNASDAPCQKSASDAVEAYCMANAARTADARLNRTYDEIQKKLSLDEQNALRDAQRLWIKFRDANCEAESDLYKGGSAAPLVYSACMEAETRLRSKDLMVGYGWRLEK